MNGSLQNSISRLKVAPPADYVGHPWEIVEQSVASLFEQRVARHGDQLALKAGDESLTYDELNHRANQVAHAILKERPYRPLPGSDRHHLKVWEEHAEPVVVFLEQGIKAIISIFGLLKAGKVFTCVNPSDPHTRNRYILRHAPARLVLTDQKYLKVVNDLAPTHCPVIDVDNVEREKGARNPGLPISPLDPVLLVYTSGSTGEPKGLVHTQKNLVHDILVKTTFMKISPSDRMSLLSWGTGQAIKLIFSALLNGASLYPFDLKSKGVGHLGAWLQNESITLHTSSAPICRSFLGLLGENEEFPHVRILRTASDLIYPEDIARMKAHFGLSCYFVNALASNETGTICGYVMNQSSPTDLRRIPVGFPVRNLTIELLDETGKVVPESETGAISVSSRFIARGYWRRPDLTRKSFHQDPKDPELMTFRSGDLARWRPDGSLELCGRSDFQVKIRGYRVDTLEVEAALLEHSNLKEAVVHPFEKRGGEKLLVGYVVPRKHPAPTISALHVYLRERLIDYMIPAAFVVMDKIPLLPNGKTNRRILPEPGRSRPILDNEYVGPVTPVHKMLVEIWSQVIGIEKVGIHDQFLELGGDSLNAGKVMARVIEAFGVDLPLRVMFESSTIAQMATIIEKEKSEGIEKARVPSITRRAGKGPWELSFGQKRLWFLDKLNPDSPAYNMPKLIRLKGELNITALSEAIEWIIRRHEILRTNYVSREGYPQAFVEDSASFELPVVDLRGLVSGNIEEEVYRLSSEESLRTIDLERDLKLLCTLYQVGEGDFVLLCLTHHIASDGWSRGLLIRELASHYGAIMAGEPSALEELPVQYSDFARWQAEQLETEHIQSQVDYWMETLKDIPGSLGLPTDRPRPQQLSYGGLTCLRKVPKEKSRELTSLAQAEHVTMFMLLLAVFNALLYRYTKQEDLVVGCPVAGRGPVETEELIGFFVNMLMIRNNLSGNPTFRELLGRVREQALGAYANPDVPFEELVRKMKPKRDSSRNPLHQVSFDVHRSRNSNLQSSGVSFSLMENQRQTSPFDQTWNIANTDEGLRIRVEYSTDLFDAVTIERMLDDFQIVLDEILVDPEVRIEDLSVVAQNTTDSKNPDRKEELPKPSEVNQITAANEFLLQEIWAEEFSVKEVDREDDFFEMGGHSLTAMRLLARINSRFGVEVSVRDLFDNPSIATLMPIIEQQSDDRSMNP